MIIRHHLLDITINTMLILILAWNCEVTANSQTNALASLLNGMKTSSSNPESRQIELPSIRHGHTRSNGRFDPSHLFESIGEDPNDPIVKQGGYTSSQSGQTAGVFVGYSTNQGSDLIPLGEVGSAMEGAKVDVLGQFGQGVQNLGEVPSIFKPNAEENHNPEANPKNGQQIWQMSSYQTADQKKQQQPHDLVSQHQTYQHQQQQPHELVSQHQTYQHQQQGQKQQGSEVGAGSHVQTFPPTNIQNKIPFQSSHNQTKLERNDVRQTQSGTEYSSLDVFGNSYQSGHPSGTDSHFLPEQNMNLHPSKIPDRQVHSIADSSLIEHQKHESQTQKQDVFSPLGNTVQQGKGEQHQHHKSDSSSQTQQQPDQQLLQPTSSLDINSLQQQLENLEKLIAQLKQQQTILEQQQELKLQQMQQQETNDAEGKSNKNPQDDLLSTVSSLLSTTEQSRPKPVDHEIKDNVEDGKEQQLSNNDYGNSAGSQLAQPGVSQNGQSGPLFVAGGGEARTEERVPPTSQMATVETTRSVPTTDRSTTEPPTSSVRPSQHSQTKGPVAGNRPGFDPQAVNDLANQEFNPLNPLNGVDLQQYLGYQTGSGKGGFDATRLNTELAKQGMLGYNEDTFKPGHDKDNLTPTSGRPDSATSRPTTPAPTQRDTETTRLTTTTPVTTTSTTIPTTSQTIPNTEAPHDTSTVDGSIDKDNTDAHTPQPADILIQPEVEKPATISPPSLPSSSSSSLSSSHSSSSSSSSSLSQSQTGPAYGNLGGGMNLMNPSSMMGMSSSGRPGMPGIKPGDMFKVEGLTDNSDGVFGSGTWNNQNGGGSRPVAWFGTNGPNKGLTRPIMANPVDPLGLMTSRGNARKRSMPSWSHQQRKAEITDKTDNMGLVQTDFFGFDPNQFLFQPVDASMNNGLGGCCSSPVSVGGSSTTDGRMTISSASSGHQTSSSGRKNSLVPQRSSSLHKSDFGNTAMSDSSSYSHDRLPGEIAMNEQGFNWAGEWPGSDTRSSTSEDNTAGKIDGALSSLASKIGMEPTSTASQPSGTIGSSSSKEGGGTWDGSWAENWPGLQKTAHQTEPAHRGTADQIGNAMARMISRIKPQGSSAIEEAKPATNDQSKQTNNDDHVTAGWDSHFTSEWRVK